VRELENVLERAFTLSDSDTIEAGELQLGSGPMTGAAELVTDDPLAPADLPEGELDLENYLETIERKAIEKALDATRWNKTAAAKRLGISFRALRYRLKKLGME